MKTVWYKVQIGGMSNTFKTQLEAVRELIDMRAGYPDKENMSEENKEYWKKASLEAKIFKVEEIETEIKI